MKKTFRNNFYMLGFVAHYTPGFFFATIFKSFLNGVIGTLSNIGFTKLLFDMIEKNAPIEQVLVLIAVVAGIYTLTEIYTYTFWRVWEPRARMNLHGKMHEMVFEKATKIDLACYDSPEFFNDFVWANHEADSRAMTVMMEFHKFLSAALSIFTVIGILLTVDVWIVLAILASVALAMVLQTLRSKMKYQRDAESNPYRHKSEYIERVYYVADYAKELRLSHADEILERDFDDAIEKTKGVFRRYGKKLFAVSTAESMATTMLIDVGIIIYLVYRIGVQHSISLGEFAACINAGWSLYWRVRQFITLFAGFKEHGLYAEKLRKFLNYEPVIRDAIDAVPCGKPFSGMELNNVTFTYPGNDQPTLRNISLKIKPKQKIALVGYNGAGKSTLIKLFMRLYDPTEGEILVNEENIKRYRLDSYRDQFGTVFQDYRIYATTIAENVLMDVYRETDRDTVTYALKNSNFAEKLATLPNGIDSELTKEFYNDGVNLSGGEAQKIAIARVFAKPSEIVILDEPSSALDPMSEYELNHAMMSAAFDKTVIFISHRLSTTCMADVIYMLENGEIIESGSHAELMELNGKYAEMFRVQAEKYQKKEKEA